MSLIEKISRDFPVGNAAGHCKTLEEVVVLAQSAAQFIVVGSITVLKRDGNPGNTFNGNLNSLGLPNLGIEYLRQVGRGMVKVAHDAGKLIFLSIDGFSPEEYFSLALVAVECGFDGIEINAGCPNVVDGGKRKEILSFSPIMLGYVVQGVLHIAKSGPTELYVLVKVSPMSNPAEIVRTADLLSATPIDAVVTQNTFPNALLFNDDGTPQIQTPDKTGWAGHAGPEIKAQALGQVSQWRSALDKAGRNDISVIGVGGVQTGKDVRDMLRAGASLVQVGTSYFVGGAKVFGDIANQYINLN
jgi:dihydroorotate dehydrogenase (fumarate)